MRRNPELRGILPALVTPLEPDARTVDTLALQHLVDHVLGAGCSGVVVLGGTGEYTALSASQRERAIAATVAHVAGRVPVAVGIVSPGLGDAVQTAQYAERHGATYVMCVTPYYAAGSQRGITDWFRLFAAETSLPIILYNIPSRTGVNLEPATVANLVEQVDQIVGIKECNTSLLHFSQLVGLVGERLAVLSGEDHYALPHLLTGAQGAVLASANLIPGAWTDLFRAVASGDVRRAQEIYLRIEPLLNAIFSELNPGPLKTALRHIGVQVGPVAPPLTAARPATEDLIVQSLAALGF
ncbi:MAG: 4-hydroxy-tetrahydrodipicolinate synthase [Thermomicrobiales bacterium]|nr:4-hydroxy-tetrahydrodipicolinate synthase [Thermomicrobiales bacterium]